MQRTLDANISNHHERVEDREPVNSVLEEGRIEVLVESVFEFDRRLLPVDFVRERQFGAQFEFHFRFGGQIHVDNSATVEADVQLLVSPQVVAVVGLVEFTDDACSEGAVRQLAAIK